MRIPSWGKVLLLALLLVAVVFILLPAPIDPAAFSPPPAPSLTGPTAPNEALRQAEILGFDDLQGAEDVAVDDEGRIYGGTVDGRIVRLVPSEGPQSNRGLPSEYRAETFADTGGRPLGLAWDAAGNLVVADADRGLLSISPTGEIYTLATEAKGRPFGFTDDLDVGPDGTVYFSDASSRFGVNEYLYDLLEARPHGRLLAYDPTTETVKVLLKDLYFANGVAVAPSGDFLLVNETYRYRVRRYWLQGPKKGTAEIFIDNLPGFPDGISCNSEGVFWLALFTVRNPLMDKLHPHPWAKRLLSKLPKAVWPKPAPYGFVMALDESGTVLGTLQDPGGQVVAQVTSVEEKYGEGKGSMLYLGNLNGRGLARVPGSLLSP